MDTQHIVSLSVENFMRVSAVNIKPDGSPIVIIGGRNAQGKSSVLSAIEAALGGKPQQSEPIRQGQNRAVVVLETEALKVTRTISAAGARLTVEGKDKTIHRSPQAVLDSLVGALSFDPLAFVRLKPAEQIERLKSVLGIDWTAKDATRKALYDERTIAGREVKQLEANLASMPAAPAGLPGKEVSVAELAAQMEAAQLNNRELDDYEFQASSYGASATEHRNKITELEESLKRLRLELSEFETQQKISANKTAAITRIDLAPIREAMASAESTNSAIRAAARRAEAAAALKIKAAEQADTTASIDAIDEAKRKELKAAKMPVDGLAFGDDGPTYNGIPFGQCSSAEQLRVSVAMGLSANPTLRVMLIRDGSLLDADSMEALRQIAENNGAQVWVERVGKGDAGAFVIEDGAIEAAPTE